MARGANIMNSVADIQKQASKVVPMSLFGASAMGFPDKISLVRAIMETRHTSQRVVLSNPEVARLFTGVENEYGERSSWNIKIRGDNYELMKVFRKFKDYKYSTTCYILRNTRTGKYKCELIFPAINLTEKYGFAMNNYMDGFKEHDILPVGTKIAQSTSYVGNNYCAGKNIRMAYTVLPELTEDALVISDYAAEQLQYNMVDIVDVDIKKDSFLLNKYGRNGEYKPFPDIGEEIENNIVCSIRENSFVSSYQEASMPHINDKNKYSSGRIVDIDIFTNVDEDNDQVNKYLSQIRDWYSSIYAYIKKLIEDPYQDDTSLLDMYHEADKWLNDSTWVTKEKIINTIIRFTVLQPKKIHAGQKVVGRMGNKSVISEIRPRELMPRTEDGRPIDMLANGLSIFNRIIMFAPYEN
jgi:DNA-directed RNA polymerase beta subunit